MTRRDALPDGFRAHCERCKKVAYVRRSHARRAKSRHRYGDAMSVYRCPHNDGLWHLGHVPKEVRQGTLAKADYVKKTNDKL